MDNKLPTSVEQFLDRFSQAMASEGLPRPAGRILGLMFVENRDVSAAELSEKLQISRSNVSGNVRVLENFGLLERTRPAGERQDLFRLPADPFIPLLVAGAARAKRVKNLVAECRSELGSELGNANSRLKDLENFFGHASQWLEGMQNSWPESQRDNCDT